MNKQQLTQLKQIANGLAALGKPGKDDIAFATRRLALMECFERLVRSVSPADRHELAQALKEMLAPYNMPRTKVALEDK